MVSSSEPIQNSPPGIQAIPSGAGPGAAVDAPGLDPIAAGLGDEPGSAGVLATESGESPVAESVCELQPPTPRMMGTEKPRNQRPTTQLVRRDRLVRRFFI